jgi:hypothetical protein
MRQVESHRGRSLSGHSAALKPEARPIATAMIKAGPPPISGWSAAPAGTAAATPVLNPVSAVLVVRAVPRRLGRLDFPTFPLPPCAVWRAPSENWGRTGAGAKAEESEVLGAEAEVMACAGRAEPKHTEAFDPRRTSLTEKDALALLAEFCQALDGERERAGVNKQQVASHLEIAASSVTALFQGGRPNGVKKAPTWDRVSRILGLIWERRHASVISGEAERRVLHSRRKDFLLAWRVRHEMLEREMEQARDKADGNAAPETGLAHLDIAGLPAVSAMDSISLGVHRVRRGIGDSPLPRYVVRDVDESLDEALSTVRTTGGALLLIGDSTAGKTRTATEALRRHLPGHRLYTPSGVVDFQTLVREVAQTDDTVDGLVVWLDDLERFLAPDYVDVPSVRTLVSHACVIIATIREEHYEKLSAGRRRDLSRPDDAVAGSRVLELFESFHVPRLWSAAEVCRAEESADPAIVDACEYHGQYGIAEYLAAGPELWQDWQSSFRVGGHPRAGAIIAAAVDPLARESFPPFRQKSCALSMKGIWRRPGARFCAPSRSSRPWSGPARSDTG